MLKKILSAVALSCSAPMALAAPTTWNFSYTGFYSPSEQQFLPDYTIAGSFTGSDSNHNGVIEKAELSSFILQGMEYAGCATETIPYFSCGLNPFTYALTGALNFSAGWDSSDGFVSQFYGITSGVGSFLTTIRPGNIEDTFSLEWTDATTLSISPAPVPEPAAASMLLAGAALLAARRRASRRRAA